MQTFDLITNFDISKEDISSVTAFISKGFTSPYLESKRKVINITDKPIVNKSAKKKFSFSDIEGDKENDEKLDLRTVSEDKLNDSLEELTDEDYEDFGEIGIEILDYVIDRVFIFMKRKPSELDSTAKKKKERLKIIAGRLFQKWGVKFSLEMLGGFLLVGYIHMRYKQSDKVGEGEVKQKVKSGIIPLNSFEKKADQRLNKNKTIKKTGIM